MFPTRKTSSVLICAALLGGALATTPAAAAETTMSSFSMMFAYNTDDPAHKIYADLKDTARKACHDRMVISYHAVNTMRGCTKSVIEAALKAMARTDVALLHGNKKNA